MSAGGHGTSPGSLSKLVSRPQGIAQALSPRHPAPTLSGLFVQEQDLGRAVGGAQEISEGLHHEARRLAI